MGVPRPEGQPALGIGEVDGPYHLALRHALAPFLSPGAVQKMRPFMEQKAHEFLDQKIADGQMDLVLDYASPVPAILTMKLMGLPLTTGTSTPTSSTPSWPSPRTAPSTSTPSPKSPP